MRELSLHILDLIENALRAGAGVIEVSVEEDLSRDRLSLAVEDDGPGLEVPADRATNPFFTTKEGKATGLGLSLFRFRVEQAGGRLSLERSPLGDLATTLYTVVLANPQAELRLRLRRDGEQWSASSRELAERMPGEGEIAVAWRMYTNIKEGLTALQIKG